MSLAFTFETKRHLFSIVAATLTLASMLVFPAGAAAQVRKRMPTGNPVLSRYVPNHFKPEVRCGRITATSLRSNFPHINSSGETLTIQSDGSTGRMELKYEGPFREGQISIVLDTAGLLEIELVPADANEKNGTSGSVIKDSATVMRFLQRPGHRLTLSLGSGSKQRVIHADTIWELLIAHREDCRNFLLPILYRLQPGWDLMVKADEIEKQLLSLAAEGKPPQYARWQKLVEQLGHDSYSQREAADRELRGAGCRVLTFLHKLERDNLDGRKLDTEQRFRIARIIRSFEGVEQSPRDIAEEMSDDPSIWLAVAADDREPARRTALAELRRLLKQPVDFDPAAEAPLRETQLRKIGNRIAGD